jgi:hypothetical protein
MPRAVPVGGPAGKLRAFTDLAGLAARDRRGVQQPDPFAERRRDSGELLDHEADLRRAADTSDHAVETRAAEAHTCLSDERIHAMGLADDCPRRRECLGMKLGQDLVRECRLFVGLATPR